MMTYVLICLVLVLLLAPLVRILPSRRQKEQMAMRKVAMAAGISVQLTTIDDPDPHREKYLSNADKTLPPGLKVIAWRCQRRQLHRDAGEWRGLQKTGWCLQRISPDRKQEQIALAGDWVWSKVSGAAMSRGLRAWLEAEIKQLPEDVEQVEETHCVVSVYWHERETGTENRVIDFLKTCTELPLHEPLHEKVS